MSSRLFLYARYFSLERRFLWMLEFERQLYTLSVSYCSIEQRRMSIEVPQEHLLLVGVTMLAFARDLAEIGRLEVCILPHESL